MIKKYLYTPIYNNSKFVSHIKKKCDIFNSYFAEQCTPLLNSSKLPSVLTVYTESILESFYCPADHIGDAIKKLDSNKAHRHDMISIRMILYRNHWKSFLKTEGIFPDEWKKANIVPIHKNIISKSYLIIGLFCSLQFVVRYLNV